MEPVREGLVLAAYDQLVVERDPAVVPQSVFCVDDD
jgi:hypothetical protein